MLDLIKETKVMFTDKVIHETSHNDHDNSARKDIRRVKQQNRDKLKPGEPIDIIGTGSNYEESDLISAPDRLVDRLRDKNK
jgi:hypothetical protein